MPFPLIAGFLCTEGRGQNFEDKSANKRVLVNLFSYEYWSLPSIYSPPPPLTEFTCTYLATSIEVSVVSLASILGLTSLF